VGKSGTNSTAIYTRISEDRDDDRLGVQRQEEDCRSLASRLGWEVGKIYEDNDFSASKVKVVRPAYQRLLKDIEAGKVRRLITDKPDRLYRRNTELEHLINVVGERVEIRTAKSGDIDLSTTNGRMIARILGATAQGEAETIRDRIKRKMADIAANGGWTGGARPFGWTPEAGKLVVLPSEAAILREAKDRVLAGESLRAICIDFARRGIQSTHGNPIQQTSLKKSLISPRVIGRYSRRDGSIVGPAQWDAIFTEDDWARLKHVLLDPARNTVGRRAPRKYLLTAGLLRCGLCGAAMFGRPAFAGRPDPYYGCKQAIGYKGCGKVHIRVPMADRFVEQKVVKALSSKSFTKQRATLVNQAPDMAAAVAALTTIQERVQELAATYGDGLITKAEWMEARKRLEPRLEAAQQAVGDGTRAPGLMVELLDVKALVTGWDTLPIEHRRVVISQLVEQVKVYPHRGSVRKPDLDRVKIIWRAWMKITSEGIEIRGHPATRVTLAR
jgi:site-specific DNA recombinase